MSYKLRYSFDAGSGICLWCGNDAAQEKFGYPVNHWELPLSENTRRWLTHLIAWYDTSLDWSSPGDTDDVWSEEELARFKVAAGRGLRLLRSELPDGEYEIVNESVAI